MERVGAGLGDDVDLAAAELAVLGVEVTGENAELGDGIEVGNDGRAHVDVFFDVAAVDDEGVGKFALAVDGDCAGIQIAGGGKRAGADILHGVGLMDVTGATPGCSERRSVKLRPLSGTAVICVPVITSPIWVLVVSTWS